MYPPPHEYWCSLSPHLSHAHLTLACLHAHVQAVFMTGAFPSAYSYPTVNQINTTAFAYISNKKIQGRHPVRRILSVPVLSKVPGVPQTCTYPHPGHSVRRVVGGRQPV